MSQERTRKDTVSTMRNSIGIFCWVLLSALGIVSCREPSGHEHSTPTQEARSGLSVAISPELIGHGRVVLVPAHEVREAEGVALQASVIPAPDAEAIVGGLVDGRVRELLAVEGQHVKKNEILAWLDAPEVGQARAAVLSARAAVALAQKSLDRERTLLNERAGTQSRLEAAEATLEGARAELSAANARVKAFGAADGDGARVALRAPLDGVIVERLPRIGEAVTASEHLFRIVDPKSLQIRGFAPLLIARQLEDGAVLAVRARVLGETEPLGCTATLRFRMETVDPGTRSLPLLLTPQANCTFLKAGLTVEVLAPLGNAPSTSGTERAFEVPLGAVSEFRGEKIVFVARGAPGQFEAVMVLPVVTRETSLVVRARLEPGEQVVETGILLLKGELLREMLGGH